MSAWEPVSFAPRRLALIGVPSSAGARRGGQELAPRHLRDAGIARRLRNLGFELIDLGDQPVERFKPDLENPDARNLERVVHVLQGVLAAVHEAVACGARPLVLGGDCTITIAVVAALREHVRSLGLMYLDGDLDLNTPETSPSGIFDGMGMAHMLGDGAPALSRFGKRFPLLDEERVAVFGYSVAAGSIDPPELERLGRSRLLTYPLEAVRGNVRESARHALRRVEAVSDHILVHFDVDVIDSTKLAAGEVPHAPGLTPPEAADALAVFLATPKSAGLVLTEFNAAGADAAMCAHELCYLLETGFAASHRHAAP